LIARRTFLGALAAGCASSALGCASGEIGRAPAPRTPAAAREAPPRAAPPPPPAAPAPASQAAAPAASAVAPGERRLRVRERAAAAETGSAFLERTARFDRVDFEQAVFDAVMAGNVPPFQRLMQEVAVRDGKRQARLWVLCDYLAIGSDEDFVRMPMMASTAQRIASACDCVLPTRRLVDEVWRQAKARLPPSFIHGGPDNTHREDYTTHHTTLEGHRRKRGIGLGVLTAGDKKDIVLTNRLLSKDDRVAIYGWHQNDGVPIQPLSTVHGRRYTDYSHGVRLVDQLVVVDDAELRLEDMYRDPMYCDMVSDEGPLEVVSYPTWLPPPVLKPVPGRKAKSKRRAQR
jgi:hypothetical protein